MQNLLNNPSLISDELIAAMPVENLRELVRGLERSAEAKESLARGIRLTATRLRTLLEKRQGQMEAQA